MKKQKDSGHGAGKDQSRKSGADKSENKKDWNSMEDQGSDTGRKGKSGSSDRDTSSKEDRE